MTLLQDLAERGLKPYRAGETFEEMHARHVARAEYFAEYGRQERARRAMALGYALVGIVSLVIVVGFTCLALA